ncbi:MULTISPECIES: TonB-dependent hemoglobin/transferrin/lactoferrin family receptor [unclassified Agarivorans]|uniref:TonB-dependent hemoglobin/transferrin/lactoferrin family receptor n=1 Tax=unclassified Agarivorans TaxID=2636026 RepID=UPI0026E15553|nr:MULTISPECIES: TonB-dependent hemoglobin/transferrin/lactoferrin family receptor [unclassified Agarivorans]MDO6684669.1 TonB-dependent hemoglobin/transferrin/lactoferrin family receptor [Agarivorans sp. 3_MG-2023]MDO6714834.1 TonB-dependent hemoglobin/transferrin/lactoferrin family receptor [Agarivorans sp. 2_MG-2023]
MKTLNRTLIANAIILSLSPVAMANSNSTMFDEVVVSATRTEQNLKDVSSSVSSVSSEQLEKQMANDLNDVVRYEPGVTTTGQGRYGTSGFNIRGLDGSRIKLMVDGIEQPTAYNPGGDVMNKGPNSYEIDTLSAVEINKGPASSLYGSDALGGAVLLRTKNPEDVLDEGDANHVAIKAGYNSSNEAYKTTLELAKRYQNWEGLAIYTYRDGSETQAHSSGADINGRDRGQADPYDFDSHNLLLKANYQLNEAHTFGVVAELFQRQSKGQILSNEGYTIAPGFTYTNANSEDEDSRSRVGLNHTWTANNLAFDDVFWQLSHQQSKSEHNNYDTTGFYGSRNRERNGEDSSVQFDAQFNKLLEFAHGSHELSYGLTAINSDFELDYRTHYFDTGTVDPGAPEVPAADSEKRGIFIQDHMYLLDERLVVTAGLRYDDYQATPDASSGFEQHNSDALTKRLGAVYHWNQQFSTFAQYSEGFRAPTLQELYYAFDNSGHGYATLSNPNLKPEESQSYELGLRANTDASSMELVGFFNDYTNFIQSVTDYSDPSYPAGITVNENIGEAEIYGVEFKGHYWLDDAFGAPKGTYSRLSVAYAQGKNKEDGSSLDSVAPLTAVWGLGYDHSDDLWGSTLNLTMVAAKKDGDWAAEDNAHAPGYALLDLTAYYQPVNDLVLRAGLFNALDQKYWSYTDLDGKDSDYQGLDRYTQPGRNWGVDVAYKF